MISIENRTDDRNIPMAQSEQKLPKPHRSQDLERFLKYCVVGVSSFAVGTALFNLFYWLTGRVVLSSTLSFILSVVNGFVWNRTWTFRDKRGRPVWNQATKYLAVSLVGYALSVTVTVFLLALWAAHGVVSGDAVHRAVSAMVAGRTRDNFTFLQVNAVGIVATAVVVAWNFLANKTWSFRH